MLRSGIPNAEQEKRIFYVVIGMIALETILVTLALVPPQEWTRLLPGSSSPVEDGDIVRDSEEELVGHSAHSPIDIVEGHQVDQDKPANSADMLHLPASTTETAIPLGEAGAQQLLKRTPASYLLNQVYGLWIF